MTNGNGTVPREWMGESTETEQERRLDTVLQLLVHPVHNRSTYYIQIAFVWVGVPFLENVHVSTSTLLRET